MKLASTALLALCLAGCSADNNQRTDTGKPMVKPASMGIINSKCPIVPSHAATDKTIVDWQGQKVGLCCAGCLSTWDQLSEADKTVRVKKAM